MRIKFLDPSERGLFFSEVKQNIKSSWKSLREKFWIPKATFEKYKSGELLIPEKIFLKLLKKIEKPKKEFFLKRILKKEDNWGAFIGGKKAYQKNKLFFKIGRKKGLQKILKGRRNKKHYKINYPITKEVCEFIGAFIGDGFLNKYKNNLHHIEFSGHSEKDFKYYQETIIPKIRTVIPDLKPIIRKVNNKNAIRVIFYSKHLFDLLTRRFFLPKGKKSHIITIPKEIMDSEDSLINSTIRGIFDTDGWIMYDRRKSYKHPYPRIGLQTVSKKLYEQVKEYLKKDFKVYTSYISKKKAYSVEIYGENQLKKWMSSIGFSNPKHLVKIAPMA